MRISVVIATYNRCHLLSRTLPTILRQDLPADCYEVVVVVDGSTDGTIAYLEELQKSEPNLRFFVQTNRGQAAAINHGLKEACGVVVLFLDDDIICSPTLLRGHLEAHASPTPQLVFGPVLVAPETPAGLAGDWVRSFCDDFFRELKPEDEQNGWFRCMAAANTSGRRETLLQAGGVDEKFFIGNDAEFGIRLWNSGLRFCYAPKAIVHQIYGKNVGDIIKDARGAGLGEVQLCRKHPESRAFTGLGQLGASPAWKREVVFAIIRIPFPIERVLRPIEWFFYRLGSSSFRKLALRVLQAEATLSSLRAATDAAGGLGAVKREFLPRLPVLLYHNIGPKRPGGDPYLTISARDFQWQIRWLVWHGYTTIRVSDWLAWLRHGKPLPEKPVLLTFDDGYTDTAEFGYPILERFGCTATTFIVSSEIGGTNRWDQLTGLAAQDLMSAEQIKYWIAHGMEFAAHSHTHPDFTSISENERAMELERSREVLTELTGAPVSSFAYPFGYINDAICEQTRKHFDLAFTCEFGINGGLTDPIRLRRASVVPVHGFADPIWHVWFGFNPILKLRRRVGILRRKLFRLPIPEEHV